MSQIRTVFFAVLLLCGFVSITGAEDTEEGKTSPSFGQALGALLAIVCLVGICFCPIWCPIICGFCCGRACAPKTVVENYVPAPPGYPPYQPLQCTPQYPAHPQTVVM